MEIGLLYWWNLYSLFSVSLNFVIFFMYFIYVFIFLIDMVLIKYPFKWTSKLIFKTNISYNYKKAFFSCSRILFCILNKLLFFIFWQIFVTFTTVLLLFSFSSLGRFWYLSWAFFAVFLYFLDNFHMYEKRYKKIYNWLCSSIVI